MSAINFRLKGAGFEYCWRLNSAPDCMTLHCTEPFIITLPSSRHDLMFNDVERDVKHKVIITMMSFPKITKECIEN